MDWSAIEEFVRTILPFLEKVPFLRAILGFVLVFFLPGFAWSLVFFKRELNLLERMVFSFGLSIAMVTLVIFGLDLLFKVEITSLNAILTTLALIILPLLIYGGKWLYRVFRREEGDDA